MFNRRCIAQFGSLLVFHCLRYLLLLTFLLSRRCTVKWWETFSAFFCDPPGKHGYFYIFKIHKLWHKCHSDQTIILYIDKFCKTASNTCFIAFETESKSTSIKKTILQGFRKIRIVNGCLFMPLHFFVFFSGQLVKSCCFHRESRWIEVVLAPV